MNSVHDFAKSFNLRNAAILIICAALTVVVTSTVEPASATGLFHTVTLVENDSISDSVIAARNGKYTDFTYSVRRFPVRHFPTSDIRLKTGTLLQTGAAQRMKMARYIHLRRPPICMQFGWASSTLLLSLKTTSLTDPVYSTQSANAPTPLTSLSNMNPVMVHPGYTFVGWNTAADATGTQYANGAIFNFLQSTGLYAIWQVLP